MQDPTYNGRVAVLVPLHLTPSMVNVEPVTPEAAHRLEFVRRGVGALHVVVPEALSRRKLIVECAKLEFLVGRDRSESDNQEIAVARQVSRPKREGSLQVGAQEVVSQHSSGNRHDLFENEIEFVERSWATSRTWKISRGHQSSRSCDYATMVSVAAQNTDILDGLGVGG